MHLIPSLPIELYIQDPAPRLFTDCRASLSSSIADTLLNRTPLHAWIAHPKLNPAWAPENDPKFDIGSAAHKLLLEKSEDGIVVIPFDDYRKDAAKAQRDAAYAQGKLPVKQSDYAALSAMVAAARAYLASSDELSWIMENGTPEQTLLWQEAGIVLRCRFDWLPNDRSLVLDYKTTTDANPINWSRWAGANTGADMQCALYLEGLKALTGKDGKFLFLIQETEPPYACSAAGLGPADLAIASDKLQTAKEIWRRCLKHDKWPAYPSRVCWLESPPYVETQWSEKKAMVTDFYSILFGSSDT